MSNPKEEVVKKEGSSSRNSSEVKKLGHYWDCNNNHVARMGKEARDGCREFMASSIAESDGKITTTLRCDACGCHRNFHRKKEEELGVENKVRYGACHKNHLAQRGKYALDGCMEFIGSSDDDEMSGGLKCDACGCHRNFHERKVVEDEDRTGGGADDDDVDSKAGLYEDCCKNHALDMGKDSYWDGCLEFMASTRDADPMKCDACGCHRNFHKRKEAAKEERIRKRPPAAASPYDSSNCDYNYDYDYNYDCNYDYDYDYNYVDNDDYYD